MSWTEKVVWSEGMYLRPQHFQQHDRYLLRALEQRTVPLRTFPWGVLSVKLDKTLLSQGKLALQECSGIFPDGTPVSIPDEHGPSPVLEIPEAVERSIVYLAVPLSRAGAAEVAKTSGAESLTRWYKPDEPLDVKDSNADANLNEPEPIDVGKLRLRLLLVKDKAGSESAGADTVFPHDDPRADYSYLGVARIVDRKADGTVVLDEDYMPPALSCQTVIPLKEFIQTILSLLNKRAEALQIELGEIGRGGASEFYNFMMLQVVNRYQPLFAHWSVLQGLHPLDLYECSIQLAGELATFRPESHGVTTFEPYRHDDLKNTFKPVAMFLRSELVKHGPKTAIEIPIQPDKHGYYFALVKDSNLLRKANFVLAVHADKRSEKLRREIPEVLTIGPPQEIAKIVTGTKEGIEVEPMDHPPLQIPIHGDYCYFELDPRSSYWKGLADAGGIALHLAGEFPGIKMSFWAILG